MEQMEYFKLCLKVMEEEKKKFNLYEPDLVTCISQMSTVDGFFERPYERCAYMYKYGTGHMNFIKDCFRIFLNGYPKIKELLSTWKNSESMKICSMSHGPALDYLALTIALTENVEVELQTYFDEVKIISKSAQWKNTYNIMVEAIQMGYLNNFPVNMICDNIEIVQNSKQVFNEKQQGVLQNVDILCMMKALNVQSCDISPEIKQYFKEAISTMKADSLLFCIDTKPGIQVLAEILCEIPGEYIYEPVYNSTQLEKFPDDYKEKYGGQPTLSARGWFFVWKKLSLNSIYTKTYPSILIEKSSSNIRVKTPVSLIGSIDGLNLINLPKPELNTFLNSTTAEISPKIECDKNLDQNVNKTNSILPSKEFKICEINHNPQINKFGNIPSSSKMSKCFMELNQENSSIDQIEKRFNELMKISDNSISMDTKPNSPVTQTELSINEHSFVCDINKFKNIPNSPNLKLKNNAEHLNLSLGNYFTESPHAINLDYLSSSAISYSSHFSQTGNHDHNIPSRLLTPDKVKNSTTTNFVEKTGELEKNDSTSQLDISKKKDKTEQSINVVPKVPPKKKSVKVGTDLNYKNEGSSSIQDLTSRIKKLVSSFESVMSKNSQCKVSEKDVAGQRFEHQSCQSCRPVTSYCQQNSSTRSSDTGFSSNNSPELPSFSGTDYNAHSNNTDMEACVHSRNLNKHDFPCHRQHFCCQCRIQNCPSQVLEHNLCCVRHNCNHEAISLNRCCGHSSQNGLNLTVPNIIIPLQNINDDTLAQLLTVLKAASSSNH